MNAFQLSSTQTFRQGFTVEPIGLHPLSWSSGDHRWSGDQARIPLSRQPIIQPVPRGSSLIDKGHLLIRKVVAYMVQQVLHFIRHAQGSDESLVSTKSCRDALFVHVQSGKHIILPGNKCLVSHLSASFGQCLLFQALYQSTRIENRHPSYKSQDARGLLPLSLLRKELFPDLSESVIPECFYRESRLDRDWTPDPFDVAQGRGEHSRTTIKTFGGDAFGINSHRYVLIPRQLAAG